MGIRGDFRMVTTALNKRWDVSPEVLRRALEVATEIIDDDTEPTRNRLSAARLIMAAEAANQKDEHKLLDAYSRHGHPAEHEVGGGDDRQTNHDVPEIAKQLGADEASVEDAVRSAGRSSCGDKDGAGDRAQGSDPPKGQSG